MFEAEKERLEKINPSLARLVLPYYKLRNRPGFDILSFDDSGEPVCIEVKTNQNDDPDFVLTKKENQKAKKVTAEGTRYLIYRYTHPFSGKAGAAGNEEANRGKRQKRGAVWIELSP